MKKAYYSQTYGVAHNHLYVEEGKIKQLFCKQKV